MIDSSTTEPKPEIIRDHKGKFIPGQSGNPAGTKPRPKLSARQAREELPKIVKRIINLACKPVKKGEVDWLERLQKDSPTQFATVILTLTRYTEADDTGPPPEESMSNQEAMEILNQVKKDSYDDGFKAGLAGAREETMRNI